MENIITRYLDLPVTIGGMTVKDDAGDYNIYINSRLNSTQQQKSYLHEIEHILKKHFYSDKSVAEKEAENG